MVDGFIFDPSSINHSKNPQLPYFHNLEQVNPLFCVYVTEAFHSMKSSGFFHPLQPISEEKDFLYITSYYLFPFDLQVQEFIISITMCTCVYFWYSNFSVCELVLYYCVLIIRFRMCQVRFSLYYVSLKNSHSQVLTLDDFRIMLLGFPKLCCRFFLELH